MSDFDNKVVLVTGGSSGIGEAAALMFAARGARLALVGRNVANLRSVADACAKKRSKVPVVIVADLATDEGVERVVKEVTERFQRLDVLVNNAGAGCRTTLETADMATFDAMFAINLRGVYNLTRLLAPALIKSKGNIVNVSSVSATTVVLGSLPYGMAKAALDHFTRLIALELGPKGVRANIVSPGLTITNFVTRIAGMPQEQYQAWVKSTQQGIPLGRACTSEDVAKAILFLASEDCELVTGTLISVDGGATLGSRMNNTAMTSQIVRK